MHALCGTSNLTGNNTQVLYGTLVTKALRFLRLRSEETASRYGGKLGIY
jgi:hypothetical protein